MLRHKAYKVKLQSVGVLRHLICGINLEYIRYKEQETLIVKTIGCSRFAYNHFLNLWNKACIETGKGLSYNTCSAMLPQMKKNEETIRSSTRKSYESTQ